MPVNRRTKPKILVIYMLVIALLIIGIVLFCLIYSGSGANVLTQTPSPSDRPDTDAISAVESPAPATIVDIAPLLTPEPTEKPPAVYRDGRFIPFLEDGLWGYKNIYGVKVIEPRFTAAGEFFDDVAFAAQNGKYGLIAKNGEYIVPPEWDEVGSFSDGLAAVKSNSRWGYVDAAGDLKIDYRFYDAMEFGCGRAAVRTSGAWCYIDVQGNTAISAKWREAGKFSADVAFVTSDEYEKDRYYMIDKVGEKIVTFGSSEEGTIYSEGFAVIKNADCEYYINSTGSAAFKMTFERAKEFSGGLAAVRENGLWGYINENGVYVIEPAFSDADSFSEGYAAVKDSAGLWGYINTKGEYTASPAYSYAGAFSGGVAVVQTDGSYYILGSDGRTFLLY